MPMRLSPQVYMPSSPAIHVAAPGGGGGATFDATGKSANIALSGGNLVATSSSGNTGTLVFLTTAFGAGGKRYARITLTTLPVVYAISIGVSNATLVADTAAWVGGDTNSWGYYSNGEIYNNGSIADDFTDCVQGDTIDIAVDYSAAKLWTRRNGGLWNENASHDPTTNVGGKDISGLGAGNWRLVCGAENNGAVATLSGTGVPSGFTF